MGFGDKNSQENVLSVVREIYFEKNEPICIEDIYLQTRRGGISDNEVAWILRKPLKNDSKIKLISGKIMPVFTTEELEKIEAEGSRNGINVNLGKIKNCIKHYFKKHNLYPKPKDISDTFYKLYGKPNMRNLERYVRKMGEEGKLERDENHRYYFEGANVKGSLKKFMVLL